MLFGSKTPGASRVDVPADTVILNTAVGLTLPQYLVRVGAYIDGQGPSDAGQVLRGVLYTAAGDLIAAGADATIAADQGSGWVWLTFPEFDGLVLPAGSYRYGIHAGATDASARLYTSELPGNAALLVQTSTPDPAGPYLWFHVDGSGNVLDVVVNDATGTPAPSNAALFVQSTAPGHPGPYVWYRVDGEGALQDVTVTVGTGGGDPSAGDAALFMQDSEPSLTYPFVWLRVAEDHSVTLEVNSVDVLPDPPGNDGSRTLFAGHVFTSGAPAHLTGGTIFDASASLLLETIDAVRLPIPSDVDDDYLATLPFDITQRVFGAAGKIRGTHTAAVAGWYGTSFDATSGANAIVRTEGMLADLVGERVLVTSRKGADVRTVAVYVHDEREFPDELADEDLLLTKRAFLALADLALDELDVTVDVLA